MGGATTNCGNGRISESVNITRANQPHNDPPRRVGLADSGESGNVSRAFALQAPKAQGDFSPAD